MKPTITRYFDRAALCVVISVACALGLPGSAKAQVETFSRISGTVTDPSGALITGASVEVRNQNTGATRQSTTNASGFYSLSSLMPGTYTVTVSHPGFNTAAVTDRVLKVAEPAQVDVSLQLGSVSQTVTVAAHGADLISTSTAEIATTVTPTLVREIPVNRRNLFRLALLAPGTVPQDMDQYGQQQGVSQMGTAGSYVRAAGVYNFVGVFVGGNRDSANNVSIDGSNIQNAAHQEASQIQSLASIQELKVESANMSAEFGNGASAINVITKSGTNAFHGELFEFLRNNKLDAASALDNVAGRKLPNYQQNQFGFAVGGPIKKNKLQFFGNYEGFRVRQGATQSKTVPPTDMRTGDFSNFRPPLSGGGFGPVPTIYNPYRYDPVTGLRQPFPGNKIPSGPTNLCSPRPTCIDPAALAFVQGWVRQPNRVIDGIPQLVGTAKTSMNLDQFTTRLDWAKSSDATIYGRYTRAPGTGLAGGLNPLEGTSSRYSSQNAIVHWTQTLKGSVVNDLMAAYSRPKWSIGRNTDVPDVSKEIGLKNTSGLPSGPYMQLGYNMGNPTTWIQDATTNTYQLKDDLTMARGRHQVKFGIEITEKRLVFPILSGDEGIFYFGGSYSKACPAGNAACVAAQQAAGLDTGGHSFADYLLGLYYQGQVSPNAAPYAGYERYYGFYAQDSWRLTSKLTLNYGIRYEHWSPWLVPRNTVARFDRTSGTIQYALQNPLDYLNPATSFGKSAPLNPALPRQGYRTGNKNFAPRIGLGYLLTPGTVVRASFGTYFDNNSTTTWINGMQLGIAPFSLLYLDTFTSSDPLPARRVSDNFPPASPTASPQPNTTPPASFTSLVDPLRRTPTVYQWSLGVQRRLGSSWALELSYLGSHTIREPQWIDVNRPALPQGLLANVSLQNRRPFPQWGNIMSWLPVAWGKYNGLYVTVKNNEWHGLTVLSNFSWAKNLVSNLWGSLDLGSIDFRNPSMFAGPYAATPAKRFFSGFAYQLPFGRGKAFGSSLHPVPDKLVSGWSISGTTDFTTGSPEVALGPDNTGTAYPGNAPLDRICDPKNVPGGRYRLQWFNTACFVTPPYGRFGTSTLGAIINPGINNWDLAISKITRTNLPKETGQVEFRFEAFNAPNHTQWGDSLNAVYGGLEYLFGRILGVRPARQIQFSLRYLF